MDEAQLNTALREAQSGDRHAFGKVYEHFSRRVFELCLRMLRSQAAAEDATSEVFERAHGALDRYDRERPFDRWILTIASRHCLNRLRRQRIEQRLFQEEPAELPPQTGSLSPLAACEQRDEAKRLERAIEGLSNNYRIPLILKYYGDLSYDEIADQLGTNRNHVAVLLYRAKGLLRKEMSRHTKDEL